MYRCTYHHYHLLDHHHDHLHGHSHEHLDHLHGDDNSNLGVPIRLRRLNLVGRKLVTAVNLHYHDHDDHVLTLNININIKMVMMVMRTTTTTMMMNLHCAVDDTCWLDRFQIPHFKHNHLEKSLQHKCQKQDIRI